MQTFTSKKYHCYLVKKTKRIFQNVSILLNGSNHNDTVFSCKQNNENTNPICPFVYWIFFHFAKNENKVSVPQTSIENHICLFLCKRPNSSKNCITYQTSRIFTGINIFLISVIICINENVRTYLKTSSLLRYVYLNLITHIKKNLSVVRCYATINIFLMTTITRINANRGVYLENLLIWKLIGYL